jgi:hypothetical protein
MHADPVLLSTLVRRANRPGLIDPTLAHAIITRRDQMVAPLPLADLLTRHTSASELPAAVPIVYAQPVHPQPMPSTPTPATPPPLVVIATPNGPERRTRVSGTSDSRGPAPRDQSPFTAQSPSAARTQPTPSGQALSPDRNPAAAPQSAPRGQAPSAGQIPVTAAHPQPAAHPQNVSAPRSPGPHLPATPSPAPPLPPAQLPGLPLPAPQLPGARLPEPKLSGPHETMEKGAGGNTPIAPAPPQPGLSSSAPLTMATQARSAPAVPAWPTDSPPANPGIRPMPDGPIASPDPAALPVVHAQAPLPNTARAVPIVRPRADSRLAEPSLTQLPTTRASVHNGAVHPELTVHAPAPSGQHRPIQTLPFVDLAASQPRQPGPPPTAPTRVEQPNTPPLDIAQIVDTVHRKFLRRLAVEAERRAVR